MSIVWGVIVQLNIIDHWKRHTLKSTKLFFEKIYFLTWFHAKLAVLIWGNSFIYSSDALTCKNENYPKAKYNPRSMYKYVYSFIIFGYLMFALYLYILIKIAYVFQIKRSVMKNGFYGVVKPGTLVYKFKSFRSIAQAAELSKGETKFDECGPCGTKFGPKDLVVELKCGLDHIAHYHCAQEWFAHNQTCPVCKAAVPF